MINNSTTAASTFVEVTTLAEEHAGQQTVNDSSDSGHSRSAQIMTELVFEVILLSGITAFGVVGNISALFTFSLMKRQLKFHRLMMMLSTFDLIYVVLSFILFALPKLWTGFEDSGAHAIFLPKALPVAQIAMTGSIYSTLAITIERYLIVCHPFYTVSHSWKAKRYIVPIVAWSVMYNSPKFFELKTVYNETLLEHNFTTGYDVVAYPMRVNEWYITIYCIWMNFIFNGLIPFACLIILNSMTLKSLALQDQTTMNAATLAHSTLNGDASRVATSTKRNEIALAKVSLMIVLIFILCHSVKWVPNIYELIRLYESDKRRWPDVIESVTHVAHFLMSFNSSVNFYVYCLKHFRRTCCPKKDSTSTGVGAGQGGLPLTTTHSYAENVPPLSPNNGPNDHHNHRQTFILNDKILIATCESGRLSVPLID